MCFATMISALKNLTRSKFPLAVSIAVALRHHSSRRKIKALVAAGGTICVEVGAGDRRGTGGWVTLDVSRGCDFYWDLRRGIPFPNESVNKIYSSHFFEHLTFSEIKKFLDECMRVLVPGGNFSICVPNARLYLEAYVNHVYLSGDTFFRYAPAFNHTTLIDYVNYTAYMAGQHKYMFDEENLLFILRSRGFRNVRPRMFDPNIDLRERDLESIYAEGEK